MPGMGIPLKLDPAAVRSRVVTTVGRTAAALALAHAGRR
jgi:hypothetical protein